jgi:hypothetical protein
MVFLDHENGSAFRLSRVSRHRALRSVFYVGRFVYTVSLWMIILKEFSGPLLGCRGVGPELYLFRRRLAGLGALCLFR